MGKGTVLVVDDDGLMRRCILRELRGHYDAVEASGYSEALAILTAGPIPDVVLCDWSLGVGPNGLAVMAAARKAFPGCTRILVSGEIDGGEVVSALRTGLVHLFIPKPWHSGELRDALRALVELRQQVPFLA
jgi:CheY-like chemotaxis protein